MPRETADAGVQISVSVGLSGADGGGEPKVGEARLGRAPAAAGVSGSGVLGGEEGASREAQRRWYLPVRVRPERGARRCVVSGSDSSSELQGEKKERTEEVLAEGSSRKEIPVIGGFTARMGRGIARTCG